MVWFSSAVYPFEKGFGGRTEESGVAGVWGKRLLVLFVGELDFRRAV